MLLKIKENHPLFPQENILSIWEEREKRESPGVVPGVVKKLQYFSLLLVVIIQFILINEEGKNPSEISQRGKIIIMKIDFY